MKVIIIGRGGTRETALSNIIKSAPGVNRVDNATLSTDNELIFQESSLKINFRDLNGYCLENGYNFVMTGDEKVIDLDLDQFLHPSIRRFGLKKSSLMLETNRVFSKVLCPKFGFNVGDWRMVSESDDLRDVSLTLPLPWVLKSNGFTGNTAVYLVKTRDAAQAWIRRLRCRGSGEVLIERYISGAEFSVTGIIRGGRVQLAWETWDYKRLLDGDEGPLTGGMGAVVLPISAERKKLVQKIQAFVEAAGHSDGFVSANFIEGFEHTEPAVIEFNVHLGSPEAEALAAADPETLGRHLTEDRIISNNKDISTIDRCGLSIVYCDPLYPESQEQIEILAEDLKSFDFVRSLDSVHNVDGIKLYGKGRVGVQAIKAETMRELSENLLLRSERLSRYYFRKDIGIRAPHTKNFD
jgi:phosphoribosylamine--glycine ligase